MTIKSSFLFALKLIFPKTAKKTVARKSVFGAIICIALSVIPLVVVLTVSDGMVHGMTERIIELSTSHLKVFVKRNANVTKSLSSFNDFSKSFLKEEGVIGAYPEIDFSCLAAGKNYRTGAQIRAVNPIMFSENKSFSQLFSVVSGSFSDFKQNSKNAVIGTKIADLLGLKVGDTFRLITTNKSKNNMIVPKVSTFNVAAIISSGYQELDSLWVFIPIDVGFSIVQKTSATFSVLLQTQNAFSSDLVRIQDLCRRNASGVGFVYRWNELNVAQFQNFSSTKMMLILIMILIVLVASINIASAIVMLVMERKKEIAILKSIGASSSGIALSFILAGVFCGLTGVIIGLPIGLICSVNVNEIIFFIEKIVNFCSKILYIIKVNNIESFVATNLMDPAYYLTHIPITIPVQELLLIVISVLFLSFLVSLIPSIKAGKERPLDIFRKV